MFWTPVDGYFPNFLRAQNMVRVVEGKIIYKMTGGETKIGSSYRGFELPRVKLQWIYDGNAREIDFGSS